MSNTFIKVMEYNNNLTLNGMATTPQVGIGSLTYL